MPFSDDLFHCLNVVYAPLRIKLKISICAGSSGVPARYISNDWQTQLQRRLLWIGYIVKDHYPDA